MLLVLHCPSLWAMGLASTLASSLVLALLALAWLWVLASSFHPTGSCSWGWGQEVCRPSSWLALVLLSCAVVEAEKKNLQNRKDCQ